MIYELYTADAAHYSPYSVKDDMPIEIRCEKVIGWKTALLWNIATLGKVKVYRAYHQNKCVHYSYVVWGKAKFPFLKKGDIEIGPCWTDPDFRGHGIYPAVLSHIIQTDIIGGGVLHI